MANNHFFHGTETTVLCACGADEVDWVACQMMSTLMFKQHHSTTSTLEVKWRCFTWEKRCWARAEQCSSCLSSGDGWQDDGVLLVVVIKSVELIWLGLLIELMSDVCSLGHNCIIGPHSGLGGLALFMTTHHGGYIGGMMQEACVHVPLKPELVLVEGVNCEEQAKRVRCAEGRLFGSISLEYNLVTSPMCSWTHFLTYRWNLLM